jgi:hypothetical protein
MSYCNLRWNLLSNTLNYLVSLILFFINNILFFDSNMYVLSLEFTKYKTGLFV